MRKLNGGANYEIVERFRLVECIVSNNDDIKPEDGARGAAEMQTFLADQVLRRETPWLGLIFDVREGPPVFGPRTREAIAGMLNKAEATPVRVAVVVGNAAIQRLQFSSVCSESAPQFSRVFTDMDAARTWVGGET